MKKILLILSLFLTGCTYNWSEQQNCISEIPETERSGIVSAIRYAYYEDETTIDQNFAEKTTTYLKYATMCLVSCDNDHSYYDNGLGPRCLKKQKMCLASELPSNAVSGIKTLVSGGSYGACQVMECEAGYSLQPDNTCSGGIIVIPPPFFPPPMPPPMPPVSCAVAPTDPMCVP